MIPLSRIATLALSFAVLPAFAADAFDADAAWSAFLSSPIGYDDINGAYQVLGDVGYDVSSVEPDGCRTAGPALRAAVEKVPVGLALRHASMLCAEALGDTATAESDLQAIGALIRVARAASGDGAWARPMRIVRPEDTQAFLHAAGYEVRYGYFAQVRPVRGFGWTRVVVDPDSGRERHLTFDWIDTLAHFRREGAVAGYPYDRVLVADAFLDNWGSGEDIDWVDARAVRDAVQSDDLDKAIGTLRGAASRGGLISALTWLETCRNRPEKAGCADGLVDSLLRPAESGQALARVILAVAYAEGVGIGRDPAAARALIESSDAAWDGQGGSVSYAGYLFARSKSLPDWLVARLDASAAPTARAAAAVAHIQGRKGALAQADVATLEDPVNNTMGRGLYVLSRATGDARAAAWLERAALAGAPEAERERAIVRLGADGKDHVAETMLGDAAHAGDVQAGLFLGYRAAMRSDFKAAEGWWLGPATSPSIPALRALAALYAEDVPGLQGDSRRAYEMYELLAQEDPEARRAFATLLLTHPKIPHEPARARRLLEQDAEAGLADAQVALAGALASGAFGAPDEAAARRWYDKAVASGSAAARSDYGMWLYRTEKTPQGRLRGLELVTKAADEGVPSAVNNVAWIRCVTPHVELRDAKAGLEASARIGDIDLLPAGLLDTVAACHAATGDFHRAIELQAMAVTQLEGLGESQKATLQRMRERLELYRAGKPYVEAATD